MTELGDTILTMVPEMRAEIAASRADVAAFRNETNEWFDKLEAVQRDMLRARRYQNLEGRT